MTAPAGRGAAAVTLGYVLAMLPVLLWHGPWDGARAVVGALHVAAAAALWWSWRMNAGAGFVADWLPLFLVPFMYRELPYLIGDASFRDAVVQRWEASLFGTQPARTMAGALPNPALSELLHLGYVLYYPIVYVPPLLLYLRGRREGFGRTMLAVMLTYVVCFAVVVVFPVEGPRYAWGAPIGAPDGPIRSITHVILERGSSRGTAFPSSHAAVALAQTVAGVRFQPRIGSLVAVISAFLMIGAVYGGFHYAIDIIAGAAIGASIGVAAAFGLRRPEQWTRFTAAR